MNCNCNHNKSNCSLPTQPNYNNLKNGFISPKKGCCDCGDENKICKNGKIIIIDKNHLYPDEGIYLEDKADGNQILHLTLHPNDYTYVVNFKEGDNFYVTHIFIHYKEDNTNNCNNVYKLYINNQRECNPIEIKIDEDLKQFNNFYIRELENYVDDPDNNKYLKGKFFKLHSMRNLEIEVSKPMNSIRLYCDDNILKNNLKPIKGYYIDGDKIVYDENVGLSVANINIYSDNFSRIMIDDYCDIVRINFDDSICNDMNYEYKFTIIDNYVTEASYEFNCTIIWANDEAPDFSDGCLYEISISQITSGGWYGVWAKYP